MTAHSIGLALTLCLLLRDEVPTPLTEPAIEPAAREIADLSATPDDSIATPNPAPAPSPGIRKLDRKTRAKVLSALAGFVILWFAVIAFIWLGARITRRYMRGSRPSSTMRPDDDDWARKRLTPPLGDDRPDSAE